MKGEWRRVIMLLLLSVIWGCGGAGKSSDPQDPPGLYSTTFNLTENPISEGGNWVNGGVSGLHWTNVSTTPGQAIGHETGASFTDGTAVLQGLSWAQDQKATAVVFATAVPIETDLARCIARSGANEIRAVKRAPGSICHPFA